MSLHSDITFWFWANQSLFLLLNATCLVEKQQIYLEFQNFPAEDPRQQKGGNPLSLTHPSRSGTCPVSIYFKTFWEPCGLHLFQVSWVSNSLRYSGLTLEGDWGEKVALWRLTSILELFFYKLNPEMEQESHAEAIDPDDSRLMDHYPTYDADFDDWPTTNADLTT
jgi:hypothetical protein